MQALHPYIAIFVHPYKPLIWMRNTPSYHRQVQNFLLGTIIVFNEYRNSLLQS